MTALIALSFVLIYKGTGVVNIAVVVAFSFTPYIDWAAHILGLVGGALLAVFAFGGSAYALAGMRPRARAAVALGLSIRRDAADSVVLAVGIVLEIATAVSHGIAHCGTGPAARRVDRSGRLCTCIKSSKGTSRQRSQAFC